MTIVETLKAAKTRIEDPQHWCQHGYAKDSNGNTVESFDPEAQSWCAMGALFSFAQIREYHALPYLYKAAAEYGYEDADILNDNCTHAQVMKMYDRAIELAEEE